MRILVKNVSILVVDEKRSFIERGSIYIKDGLIRAIGPGDLSEELGYPDMEIGGENRVAVPGFIDSFADTVLYPLRYVYQYISRSREIGVRDLLSVLTENDLFYLVVLGVVRRVLNGYTTVATPVQKIDLVAKTVDLLGTRIIALIDPDDMGREEAIETLARAGRWHNYRDGRLRVTVYTGRRDILSEIVDHVPQDMPIVVKESLCGIRDLGRATVSVVSSGEACREGPVILAGEGGHVVGRGVVETVFGSGYSGWIDYNKVVEYLGGDYPGALYRLSRAAATLYKLSTGSLEPGLWSDIVVYDFSETPVLAPYMDLYTASRIILEERPRIETMIVGDEVVIDGGELLPVGRDLYNRARRRYREIVNEVARGS